MENAAMILRLLQISARHFGVELKCLAAAAADATPAEQVFECCMLAGSNCSEGGAGHVAHQ